MMRKRVIATLASLTFAFLSLAGFGQAILVQDGGSHGEKLVSIFVPPILNAPMNFVLTTEWSRALPGGGSFTSANERRVERDSRGRIYQERWFLAPKGGTMKSVMLSTEISDPAEHTLYNCEIWEKTCYIENYTESPKNAYTPSARNVGVLPGNIGTRTRDELGVNTIQGVEAIGSRETTTINVGVEGNDRPMVTTREYWFAPTLGINVISMLDDPRSGRQSFTVKELSLSEPDPSVFALPEGYKVVDERRLSPN